MLLPATAVLSSFDPRPWFWRTRDSLLDLVDQLSPSDWQAATVAVPWRVQDIVAHLVGDDLARLSRSRDRHQPGGPVNGEALPDFLDRHNAEWVGASQRLSPRVLAELLTASSSWIRTYWEGVDLGDWGEPVSWVGSEPATARLDCARDFTEDWVHQRQIRAAIGDQSPPDPAALGAVVDTFMHAVPKTLEQLAPNAGSGSPVISIVVGDAYGATVWSWTAANGRWNSSVPQQVPTTTLRCSAETWWQLCVRMITPDQARRASDIAGEDEFADAALQTIAIIRRP